MPFSIIFVDYGVYWKLLSSNFMFHSFPNSRLIDCNPNMAPFILHWTPSETDPGPFISCITSISLTKPSITAETAVQFRSPNGTSLDSDFGHKPCRLPSSVLQEKRCSLRLPRLKPGPCFVEGKQTQKPPSLHLTLKRRALQYQAARSRYSLVHAPCIYGFAGRQFIFCFFWLMQRHRQHKTLHEVVYNLHICPWLWSRRSWTLLFYKHRNFYFCWKTAAYANIPFPLDGIPMAPKANWNTPKRIWN